MLLMHGYSTDQTYAIRLSVQTYGRAPNLHIVGWTSVVQASVEAASKSIGSIYPELLLRLSWKSHWLKVALWQNRIHSDGILRTVIHTPAVANLCVYSCGLWTRGLLLDLRFPGNHLDRYVFEKHVFDF